MLDAKLAAAALDEALESLLDVALRYDRYGGACMAPLAGKTVAVHLSDLDRTFYLIVQPGRIVLSRALEGEADARIRTPVALWPLIKRADVRAQLSSQGRIALEGDVEAAEALLECLGRLSPDIGAWIERWLGRLPASLFAQAQAGWHRSLQQVEAAGRDALREYLQFEAALLPTREEYAAFARQVAETAARTERLLARLAQRQPERAS